MNVKRQLLTFTWLIISTLSGYSSHIPGGNITYECIGPNQFILTLTLFEDCGTAFQQNTPATIDVTNSCGFNLPTITLANTVFQEEVSQLCDSQLPSSECNGGALPGIYMHIWQDTVTLPGQCDSWTFSYSLCCRNSSNNLVGTSSTYYVESVLNSQTSPCNNSPVITTQLIPYVCNNQPITYNLAVNEVDGNTLQYFLVDALQGPTNPVPYQGGFTGVTPIPGITLNSSNGDITFTPTTLGNYVVSVLIVETDINGNVVGSIIQDFQFEVINCPTNNNPIVPAGITNFVGTAIQTAPSTISMCTGDNFCFQVEFTDLNAGDSLFISSNIASALPGATFTQLTFQSPAIAEVCWSAGSNSPDFTSIMFNAQDNACPIFGITFFSVQIDVTPATYAGPNQIICAGQNAPIQAVNGSVFVWTSLFGDPLIEGLNFSCDTCSNPIASPSITTQYEVVSDLNSGCINRDTIEITVVPDFSYSLTQSTTTACMNNEIALEVIPNPSGAYTYQWSPTAFLDNPNSATPLLTPLAPGNLQYIVEITGPNGCVKTDTIYINVANSFAPNSSILASPINLNCGDTVQLQTNLGNGTPLSCGASAILVCQSTPSSVTVGAPTGQNAATTYPAPFGNWYRNAKHQFLYTAAELLLAGIIPGKINAISWDVSQLNGTNIYNNYTVSMGCTNSGSMASWITGLTEVFSPQNIIISLGTNTLSYTTAYEWDGISNIVVEICYNNLSTNFTSNSTTPWETTAFNSSIYFFSDNADACVSTATPTTSTNRPITTFQNCSTIPNPANYSFQWTPTVTIDNPIAQSTFAVPTSNTTYQVVVTDLNGGCSDTSTVNITVQCCDSPIPTVTDVSCNGASDGSISAQPIGVGGSPWQIDLIEVPSGVILQTVSGVTTNTTFSNLPGGTYTISTTDVNGCTADTTVTLFEPIPVAITISSDTAICVQDTIQLIVSGGVSYSWLPNTNISSTIVNNPMVFPIVTQQYVVQVTDASGCSNQDSVLVTVNNLPVLTVSNDTTICAGDSIQLSVSGANSYIWSPNTTIDNILIANPLVFPINTTNYIVNATDINGCMNSDSTLVSIVAIPAVSAGPDISICLGDTTQLSASGATNYTWTPLDSISNININNPLVWPSNTTNYIVIGTDGGLCSASDTVVVSIFSLPNVNAGIDRWLCPGDTVILNGNGIGAPVWIPSTYLSNTNILNPVATALDTISYILEITDANGCTNTDTITVFANPIVPTFAGNDMTICEGDTIQIGGSPTSENGTTYLWNNSGTMVSNTVSNPFVFPSITTVYIVSTTNDTCSGADTITVTVNPAPFVDAGNDTQICIGNSAQLQATGAVSYLWTPNTNISNNAIDNPIVTPTDTLYYYVVGTDVNGCQNNDSVQIIVNPLPTIDAGIDQAFCDGDSVQLNAIGAGNFSWNPTTGLSNGNISNPWATPILTTTYTVSLTDSNSCINSGGVLITVNTLPTVSAGNDASICIGDSTQLLATGAISYIWSPITNLSNNLIANPWASPSITVNYSVIGTDINNCVNSDTIIVTVNSLPFVDAGIDTQICIGNSAQLLATGAVSYLWTPNTNISNNAIDNPIVTPTDTLYYYVIGTDVNGCQNNDSVQIIVNPLPTIDAGIDQAFCDGDSVQLNAIGVGNFSWNPTTGLSNGNISNPWATPTVTTTYTVSLTDSNSCIDSDGVLITVNTLPAVSAGNDIDICIGDSTQLLATGAISYIWSPITNLSNNLIANPWASPSITIDYSVIGTDINNCINYDTMTVTVNSLPFVDAGIDTQICIGNSAQLLATGAVSYLWTPNTNISNNAIDNPIVTPTDTLYYYVIGTDVNGCQNNDSVQIIVNPLPTIDAGLNDSICLGDVAQLMASGGMQYSWTPASTLNNASVFNPIATPDTTITYYVTGTDSNFCINNDSVIVNVFRVTITTDQTICNTDSLQLNVYGAIGTSYNWSPGVSLSDSTIVNPIATPNSATSYSVTVTDVNGCIDQATVTIDVNELPIPDFTYMVDAGCNGVIIALENTSQIADNYLWEFSNGVTTEEISPEIELSYSSSYNISLTAYTNQGCSAIKDTNALAGGFDDYYSIFIPNVFTPNNDGQNDVYIVKVAGKLYECIDMKIFNRWGELLFVSTGNNTKWDGYTNVGQKVPEGVYFYTIEVNGKSYNGTLQLFR